MVLFLAFAYPGILQAGQGHLNGQIINITSTASGLMLMLDTGVPDNCHGTPYNWLLIPESNKAMIATLLMFYSLDKNRGFTIYTDTLISGFCVVNQVDPVE